MNRSALERRCETLTKRRSIKKEWQAAWLLKSLRCMDLTTLSSDDTPDRVGRLCAKARQPLRLELIESLGLKTLKPRVGAVCVYHAYVETAVDALKKTGIPVAAVSTGFPHGLNSMPRRIEEIKDSVAAGAEEIDIVITRAHVFSGNWKALYAEISTFRKACGDAHLKTILGTGELGTFRNVAKASLVCMMAGADFIKTSTGKESVNATLPVSLVMLRMIREYFENTGFYVGFKPAGGIRTAKQSLDWLVMMKEELGREWLEPDLFRFGASGLLTDIERQLEHFVTGRYSASHRQPTA
ncbi:MAG: deoxyribose-phosphate aldolase [Deltaproteobacteria bacterium]|jgi:deoxyribose-phosphate aldolase|nr:deoxyribose-phosphate aldolase [Deltaproteobacteria bacterium]